MERSRIMPPHSQRSTQLFSLRSGSSVTVITYIPEGNSVMNQSLLISCHRAQLTLLIVEMTE